MQTQIFDQTTAITSTAAEIFNSETYQGGILNVADAVIGGFALTNTGSAQAQLQLDIKLHPFGAWITERVMEGDFNPTFTANLSNTFVRHASVNTGLINANASAFFTISTKFIYAVRVLSKMKTGSSGNSVRVRGNFKIAKDFNYVELANQTAPTSLVTSASQPIWTDVSEHAYFSAYLVASGTGIPQSVGAGTLPGIPGINTLGGFIGFRFYPNDADIYWVTPGIGTGAIEGAKASFILQRTDITSTFRTPLFRLLVEGFYEIGVLFSLAPGQAIDHYFSMNG